MDQTLKLHNNIYLCAGGSRVLQEEKGMPELPFYKFLEALERTRQWTERDVLRRLGVPRTTYRSWRDGTSEPSKRVYWIKLSKAFGIPIEALIRADLRLTGRVA